MSNASRNLQRFALASAKMTAFIALLVPLVQPVGALQGTSYASSAAALTEAFHTRSSNPTYLYNNPYMLAGTACITTIIFGLIFFMVIAGNRKGTDGRKDPWAGTAYAHDEPLLKGGKGGGEAKGGKPEGGKSQGKPEGGEPEGGKQMGKSQGGMDKGKGKPAEKGDAAKGKQGKGPAAEAKAKAKAATTAEPDADVAKTVSSTSVAEDVPPGSVPEDGPRAPVEGMKMQVTFEVKNGTGMPSINTFGGCDPFVEIRCVNGDPAKKKGGGIEETCKCTAKTKAKDNCMAPVWNEKIILKQADYGKDKFFNIILWDSNVAKDTPIGYHTVNTVDMFDNQTYDPKGAPTVVEYTAENFTSLLTEAKHKQLKCVVNMSYSFLEVHNFKIHVKKGTRLPKVDTIGSIDAFVEARVVAGDPRTLEYNNSPGAETKWSGKTKTIEDNMDPAFNENLAFTIAANPEWHLMIVVNDSATVGNTPLGMAVVPLRQICCNQCGVKQEFKSKLEKLPNWPAVANLKLASVTWSITHDIAKS